ncbi:maleylpyruvate isomerase N-terminal domain-containing protein [Ilumatobacter sp.]|uniref:maleylpyruvate isomerase N-terminal domain-containing protein n=1 Tax=Ilumatobacter sp. TaxID=1967498 RepID=UPI003B51FE1A
MNDLLDVDATLGRIEDDTSRIAASVTTGDLRAPVAACPGWDVRELAVHVGTIHRWATEAVRTAGPPESGAIHRPERDAPAEELGAWLRLGSGLLCDALRAASPQDPSWHPFPYAQTIAFWPRRQMVETAMHRWDTEVATAGASDLEPSVAVVGIAEYFELGLPRVLDRSGTEAPSASMHVHCTDDALPDGAGEWFVSSEDGVLRVEEAHRRGDCALRGCASDLLLVLMGRRDRGVLDVAGDPTAASAWLDLPGW